MLANKRVLFSMHVLYMHAMYMHEKKISKRLRYNQKKSVFSLILECF